MNGRITVEDATIYDVLDLVLSNSKWGLPGGILAQIANAVRVQGRRLSQFNPAPRSRRNVAHHYDLSDRSTGFSSTTTGNTPAPISRLRATRWKPPRRARSAMSRRSSCSSRGQQVLDIGSGWGGLGLYLARWATTTSPA